MKPSTFHEVLTSLDHTEWDTIYHSQWANHTEKSNTIAHYVVADESGPLRSQRLIKLALMEPSMFYQSNDLGVSPIEALTGNGPQLFETVKKFPTLSPKEFSFIGLWKNDLLKIQPTSKGVVFFNGVKVIEFTYNSKSKQYENGDDEFITIVLKDIDHKDLRQFWVKVKLYKEEEFCIPFFQVESSKETQDVKDYIYNWETTIVKGTYIAQPNGQTVKIESFDDGMVVRMVENDIYSGKFKKFGYVYESEQGQLKVSKKKLNDEYKRIFTLKYSTNGDTMWSAEFVEI